MAGKPLIAITMGDPCGIGPEVVAKALAQEDVRRLCRPLARIHRRTRMGGVRTGEGG